MFSFSDSNLTSQGGPYAYCVIIIPAICSAFFLEREEEARGTIGEKEG
jgi:hypothetical protein